MKKSFFIVLIIGLYFSATSQNIEWAVSISGPDDEFSNVTAIDKNGVYYITGTFFDSIDVDPSENEYWLYSRAYYDTYFAKFNSKGELLYAHSINGISSVFTRAIHIDEDQNYYISGKLGKNCDLDPGPDSVIYSTDYSYDAFVQKFDSSNNLVFGQRLDTKDTEDRLYDITTDLDGNIYYVGHFHQTVDFDLEEGVSELSSNGYEDAFVAKYSPIGEFIWAKSFGSYYKDFARVIATDPEGNLLIGGNFSGTVDFDPGNDTNFISSVGVLDAYLLSLNPQGELNWVKTYGGQSNDYIKEILFDSEGHIIVSGTFRFNCNFNPYSEEGYYVQGSDWSSFYVLKLNQEGEFIWVKVWGEGDEACYPQSINMNEDHIFLSSNFDDSFDILPEDSTWIVEPIGGNDFFVMELSPHGEVLSSMVLGSEYYEYIVSTKIYEHQIYINGMFRDQPEWVINESSASLEASGRTDVFILKINLLNTMVFSREEDLLSTYPNPNKGSFIIQSSTIEQGQYSLKIYDLTGKTIIDKNIIVNEALYEKIDLPIKGIYIIEVSNSKVNYKNKMIISGN